MTLSGYFMSKSVFVQQGCRALTLALARLSCYYFPPFVVNKDFHYLTAISCIAVGYLVQGFDSVYNDSA